MSDLFKPTRLVSEASAADSCAGLPPIQDAPPVEANGRQSSDSGAATAPAAAVTPLGALLARHILRDGEVVLLVLKPSLWYILLSSLRFAAIVLILMLAAIAFESRHNREWFYIEAGIFLLAGRVMGAVLAWMGRLYVLTDLRVIRLSGVFRVDIFDCALRKIARTQVVLPVKERLCGTGTLEIYPQEADAPGLWQTISRPLEVNDLIVRTIEKARQHGLGAAA